MNNQIEKTTCKECVHYEVCRFVNALAVASVVNAKNCRMFKDIKDYRKASEWISVGDRLPERNGRYLTHCNIEGQSLVCVLYYSKVGGFNEGTVTHWMPLPEAPNMRGN